MGAANNRQTITAVFHAKPPPPPPRGALEGEAPQRRPQRGGGCRSGWGRLLSVTNAIEAGTWPQGHSGWESAGRRGGGVMPPPLLHTDANPTPPAGPEPSPGGPRR